MRIIMDDREPATIEAILRSRNVRVEKKRIEVADYLVGPEVCVERKTVSDFLKSIYEGRLQDQVSNMLDSCSKVIVVVEGRPHYVKGNARLHMLGALASLAYKGASTVTTLTMEDTALFLVYLARKIQGTQDKVMPIIRRKRPKGWENALAILTSFPGIGVKSAEKVLREYRNLREVFTSDFNKLRKVLGDYRARKMVETLDTPFKIVKEEKLEDQG